MSVDKILKAAKTIMTQKIWLDNGIVHFKTLNMTNQIAAVKSIVETLTNEHTRDGNACLKSGN